MAERAATSFGPRQLALLVALTVTWGLNWPVMKLAIAAFPPLSFRAIGMWLGLALLWLFMRARKTSLVVARADWRELGMLAFTNTIVWHVLAIVSLQQLSSGRAAILGYTMPIFSAVLGFALYGDRLAGRQLAGVAAAAGGVALLIWHELDAAFGHPLAAAGMLIAAATWALGTQQLRRTQLTVPILAVIFWMTAITTVVLSVLALWFESSRWHAPNAATLFGIAYNAVLIIAFAQPVWLWLARTLPPVASTLSVMMIPVIGTLSGAWTLHERIYWQDGVAMFLMLVAIASVLAPRRASTAR